MTKHKKIRSKEKLASKLHWLPSIVVLGLTLVLMFLKWDNDLSIKENAAMMIEVPLTYFIGPIFIGYIIFSLDLMKEIDDEQWEKQKQEEKREKERKSSKR